VAWTGREGAKDAGEPNRHVGLGCEVACSVGWASSRTGSIAATFGIPLHARRVRLVDDVEVEIGPGQIVALVGPSGSGKSSALDAPARAFPLACLVQHVGFPEGVAIVDRVAVGAPLPEALALLTSCGLGDAHLWVRPFAALSEGERFRARLARAISIVSPDARVAPLVCDEFCTSLDRTTARAVSFNARKLVTRRKLSLIVACHEDDILSDLQPDTLVRFAPGGRCGVEHPQLKARRAVSFRRRLVVTRGCKADYESFGAMHYRATDELGFVDKIFVLRERGCGEVLAIVVYSHGPLELAMRNRATVGRYSGKPGAVNRHFRILRRLVVRSDVRGCGLGHYLVRKTLPLVGTKYVECLAAMGEFNPVFEKAGMKRVGQYEVSPLCRNALDRLSAEGVDPASRTFGQHVARRRRVREIVARVVHRWYSATTGGGGRRVQRQSPELLAQLFRGLATNRPVYYLWQRKARIPELTCSGHKRRRRR